MTNLNTDKKSKIISDEVLPEIPTDGRQIVERGGIKYLTRHLNGLRLETRLSQ